MVACSLSLPRAGPTARAAATTPLARAPLSAASTSSSRFVCRAEPEDKKEDKRGSGELGTYVVADKPLEIPEDDMWEGESMEWLGKLAFYFIPIMAGLGILVGAFASKTYDQGATEFLVNATENNSALIVSEFFE